MRCTLTCLLFAVLCGGEETAFRGGASIARLFPGLRLDVVLGAADGGVIVAGTAEQPGLPVTPDALQQQFRGGNCGIAPGKPPVQVTCRDLYIARLSPAGELAYGTYLGGSDDEALTAAAVTPDGGLVMLALTIGTDFPIPLTSAGSTGRLRWFLLKLAPNLRDVEFGRVLPIGDAATPSAMTLDTDGSIVVAGSVSAGGLAATPDSVQTAIAGLSDAFVARFAADATPLWSTYLGGTGFDEPVAVATRNGSIYVAGGTTSTDFPKTPAAWFRVAPPTALQRSTFVSIVSGDGRSLIASSVFGGEANDFVRTMAVATDGSVLLGGNTHSSQFPVTIGPQPTGNAAAPFLVRLHSDLSAPVFSTLFTTQDGDVITLLPDTDGTILVAGSTSTRFWPTTPDALERCNIVAAETVGSTFLRRVSSDGTTTLYSSFFNAGTTGSNPTKLARDTSGRVVVGGYAFDADLSFYGGPKSTIQGAATPFVITLDPQRVPARSRLCIVNAASFADGIAAPGETVALFGTGLGPASPATGVPDENGSFPTALGGTRVLVNGSPTELLYAADGQINGVLPQSLGESGSATVEVEVNGTVVDRTDVRLFPVHLGVFRRYFTETAAAVNENGRENSSTDRAGRGSVLRLYVTGLGAYSNGGPVHPVRVYLGGMEAQTISSRLIAPGVVEISVRVPADPDPSQRWDIGFQTDIGWQMPFLRVWVTQ